MDKYKEFDGREVDLDRLDTYLVGPAAKLIDSSTPAIIDECYKEIGYALTYIKYRHPDIDFGDQCDRVEVLGMELSDLDKEVFNSSLECQRRVEDHCCDRSARWCIVNIAFKARAIKLHFRILAEIENMC